MVEFTDGWVTVINIRNDEFCTIKVREELPGGMIHTFKLWENLDGPPSLQQRYDNLAQLSILRDALSNEIKIRIGHDPTSSKIQFVILSTDVSGFGPYLVQFERELQEMERELPTPR